MKKVMVLGASYLQTFMIKAIKELGHYCVSVDANPTSEGFNICDKYYVCSTVDREAVLSIAKKENIDAIVTYASDVAAPTVAFVAEEMDLPTNPLRSVEILTDKSMTRSFMETHGFNVPKHAEASTYLEAMGKIQIIGFPAIVKPTDSSGSKGVTRINNIDEVKCAFEYAMSFSRSKRVEIESFIKRTGYQIDADCLVADGKIVFFEPMDQHQDPIAPFSPIGISAPSILDKKKADHAKNELQRLISLLGMRFGNYNVEYIYDNEGRLFFLEVGPRGGGNLIPDAILAGTGLDLRQLSIRLALGEKIDIPSISSFRENITTFIIHSQRDGKYLGLSIAPQIEKNIIFQKVFVNYGDPIHKFTGGAYALGFCLLRFEEQEEMLTFIDNSKEYYDVITGDCLDIGKNDD